jgi:two-component system response regulator AtoC
MPIQKVLVADDEPLIRSFLLEVLRRKKMDIHLAKDGEDAIKLIEQNDYDLIISDMKMPNKNGLEVLQYARQKKTNAIVIIITAFATIENAVEAMNRGAFNYLLKPFTFEAINALIDKANQHMELLNENEYLKKEIFSSKHISYVGESPFMKKLFFDLPKIASSNASILITGESGTGKEVVANAIHYHSLRAKKPFIKVNCAAIADTLIESEFFGHERGAFTGAEIRKIGRLELANEGSLLLDEVSEIPMALQAKLLRAIQEQEFEMVGSTKSIKVNIRFIATSNRNLLKAIEDKTFREDLYFRLNVIPINIPPLRERKEDILALAQYLLKRFCEENHKPLKKLSTAAEKAFLEYSWPGNVRELANILERTVVMDFSEVIQPDQLFLPNDRREEFAPCSLKAMEEKIILRTLKEYGNNKTKAAHALGISIRTLQSKLKLYQT